MIKLSDRASWFGLNRAGDTFSAEQWSGERYEICRCCDFEYSASSKD